MNASRWIIETLRAGGIDTVFGLPGVHALGLWKAVEDSGINYVGFRHEQAAAHAADGYGRATGKPGVVLLSTGPGALNSLSALGEAYVSSSPVFAIASTIPSHLVGKQKGYLHDSKDLTGAFASVTRFVARAQRIEEVPKLVNEALNSSVSGRPGPVALEIPADLFDADIEAELAVIEADLRAPSHEQIRDATLLLGLAARPVIWAGGGVLRSRASDELMRVAELLGAPVITTFMGKGAIPEDHRLCVGTLLRQPEVWELLKRADLLLSIGTRFSGMATGNWKLELPSQHIHIDIDPEELGRNYPLRLGIAADAKAALAAIAAALESNTDARSVVRALDDESAEFRSQASAARKTAFDRARSEAPQEMAILEALRRAIPPEIVTVQDMTIPSYWAAPFFPVTVPGTFHYPYGFGSLGFSYPTALGIAASDPSRSVVAFSGDGGFQYHLRELATAKQYRLPVTVIVFNDGAWGVLKSFAGARYSSSFGLDLPGPDFVKLAQAYGVDAESVQEPDGIEKAVSKAIEAREPRLVEVPGHWKLPPPSDYYKR